MSGQGVLSLWLLRMRDDARLRSPCWSSHANYRFPHGGAAKPTGTNNLWHTAVRVLIDYLLFRRRWFALDEPCKMTIIEWNFDLTKISALVFGDETKWRKLVNTHQMEFFWLISHFLCRHTSTHTITPHSISVKLHVSFVFWLTQRRWSGSWFLLKKGNRLLLRF